MSVRGASIEFHGTNRGVDIGSAFAPWWAIIEQQVPGVELFDAHAHLGQNDPDGFKQQPDELLASLRRAHARGCFVFPMHELDGYKRANDAVIAASAETDGMFVPFCRVKPGDGALTEARRALDAGARGIKLHPRAEQFTLDHPEVRELFALADERSLPVLIHAGRGIPQLGVHAVKLATEFPDARVILAHAGISDLGWIWRAAAELPNLLFDSAWWMPADLIALFTLVPPGNIVYASDSPYGDPLVGGVSQLRLALQAGMSPDQIRLLASEQSLRIAAGEPLRSLGPAVGERDHAPHVLLDRVAEMLQLSVMLSFRGVDGAETLSLARQACDVPDGIDDGPVFTAMRYLLDQYDAATAAEEGRAATLFLMLAAMVARTPDVPVPSFG